MSGAALRENHPLQQQAPQKDENVPEIDPKEIVFERKIGEGTYGTVFAGKCRGKEVAIKVFKRKDDALSDSELEKFREEVKIMSKLPHPNVVLFMGACTKRGKDLMIVTDLFPTDMETLLIKQRHETSIFQRICMARDAALGMNWLHCSDPIFIHRDLKLSNLLVNKQFRVSVCDFGLAQIKPKNVTNLDYDPHGSPIYMAPEVFVGEYNEKCDIYSFSICLWEIYTCRQAFTEMDDDLPAFIHAICDCDHRPVIPSGCSKRLAKLITLGWSKNPQLRPSFKAILDELNKLLIEIAIEDDAGRKMWRKYFFDKLEVTWNEFITALFKTLHILDSPHHPSSKVEALRNLLAEENKGVYGSDNVISIQNFGKILSYFGPLKIDNAARKTDESFLIRVEKLMSEKWYHGNIDQDEATKRLTPEKPGTFLVRLSSTPGCFTISQKTKDKQIIHSRIRYEPRVGFHFNSRSYLDFNELIKIEGKKQGWKHQCVVMAIEASNYTNVM